MKVSLNWLQDYVSIDMSVETLVNSLTMLGLEVESVNNRFDFFKNIYICKINDIKNFSGFNDIFICNVNCGIRSFNVVSKYKNLSKGILIPVAFPGTVLANGITVYEKKISTILSLGKFCSKSDLGIGSCDKKVIILNEKLKSGESIKNYYRFSDIILEVSVTPNRSDCLSMIGIAREIAALSNVKIKYPNFDIINFENIRRDIKLNIIVNKKICYRYVGLVFDSIEIKSSPYWLKKRLLSVGLKPVNNIVDITNFIMFETGQPIHSYDYDLIVGSTIIVDNSKGNEILKTLDGKNRVILKDFITIYDVCKPIAIAGIIGGLNSSVNLKTKRVVIEVAHFDSFSIRKMSKKLGLVTESSYRFERGVDSSSILNVLSRISSLIIKLSSGRVVSRIIDKKIDFLKPKKVKLSINKVNALLGTDLSLKKIQNILNSLSFNSKIVKNKILDVEIPSFRLDIKKTEDLIEEVARLYGYDNIPTTFPVLNFSKTKVKNNLYKINFEIKNILNGIGFTEVINYTFGSFDDFDFFISINDFYRNEGIKLLNPISSDKSLMRVSILPGLLKTLYKNISKQNKNLKIFEIGKVFLKQNNNIKELIEEFEMLSGVWTGLSQENYWYNNKNEYCDFYNIKGVVEELFSFYKIHNIVYKKNIDTKKIKYVKNGILVEMWSSNRFLGFLGEFDSDFIKLYSIEQPVFFFDINLKNFNNSVNNIFFKSISKFPSISRDASIIVEEQLEYQKILDKIVLFKSDIIKDIILLDIFRGSGVGIGFKSISFRVIYQSMNTTLNDIIVNDLHKRIISYLIKEFFAKLP